MEEQSKESVVLQRIDDAISSIRNKDFTMFFFVINTMKVPNGSMSYIYQLAKYLKNAGGYNVKMVYQLPNEYTEAELEEINKNDGLIDEERVFHPASEWMGEEYADLPHMNLSREEWKVSPSDFLFIPEALSALMFETFNHHVPCRRYVILQKYNCVTDFIPLGLQWSNYGIVDAICTTDLQAEHIKEIFPYMRTKTLNPYIDECFRMPVKPRKLIVNVVAKDQRDVNRIVKPFYWKYPVYKFVSFRELRGFPREEYAEMLKEGAITVWADSDTQFGYTPLEAMRCGNIVIGKVPEEQMEWMYDSEGNLRDNAIWFTNINDVHKLIASVLGAWMNDEIPSELTQAVEETNKMYTFDAWRERVDELMDELLNERIVEFETARAITTKKMEE